MPIKAVIFDLDGTITQPYFDFDAIRLEMGLAVDSGPVLETMEKMTPEQRQQTEKILHYHEQKAVDESTLNPGVENTLSRLREKNIKIGILTRNRRCNALKIEKKFNLKFDIVIGREQGPAKPDAFGVRTICEHFNIEPFQAMVVGDYLFDILCARKAGSVAVLLDNHPNAHEFSKEADFTIKNINEILKIVENTN
jgi:HAD superfamily hydrolase (TIGR01509 family)